MCFQQSTKIYDLFEYQSSTPGGVEDGGDMTKWYCDKRWFNFAFASSALQPGRDEAHPRGADQPRPGGDRVLLRDEQGEQAQGGGHLQVDPVPAGGGHGGPRQVHTPHAQARADHRHSREADGAEIVIDSSVSRFTCERDDVESDSCR